MTRDSCPEWCAGDHGDEDPEHDVIIHESTPITLDLPPLVSGDRIRLAFTTVCDEDFHTKDEGRSPTRIDAGTASDEEGHLHDWAPVPSVEVLDRLINDLRAAASALEHWRVRIPSAT